MGNKVDYTNDTNLMKEYNNYQLQLINTPLITNLQSIQFPLSTKGIMIIDAKQRRLRLCGGNLSGAHMCRHCIDGLQCVSLLKIAQDIRYKFKMNCVRLTYSLQMYYDDIIVPEKYLKANPDLIGKSGMQIFDITIQTLTKVGLMVILNNHISTSQWCCSNEDGDGLWWSYQYPQYQYFQCAEHFAHRYGSNPRVIGMDLRNQIRKAHGIQPTWGDGNAITDWKRAAKICGEKVLAIAPHWLIIVGCMNYQLDLTPIKDSPLYYSVPNKLVYSGHFYGFSWAVVWKLISYEQFKTKFFNTQTFVRGMGYPFLLGEFGNNQRDIPWKYLMQYFQQTHIDWTYWALDGFKCDPSNDQTYGIFTNDYKHVRHPDMLEDLIKSSHPAMGS